MSNEYSPQQDAGLLWEAAITAIQDTGEEAAPWLLGHSVSTVPPNSTDPQQIALSRWSDGSWSDKQYTLTINQQGPVSYEYSYTTWNPPVPEADIEIAYGPEAPETIAYLGNLAMQLRAE